MKLLKNKNKEDTSCVLSFLVKDGDISVSFKCGNTIQHQDIATLLGMIFIGTINDTIVDVINKAIDKNDTEQIFNILQEIISKSGKSESRPVIEPIEAMPRMLNMYNNGALPGE